MENQHPDPRPRSPAGGPSPSKAGAAAPATLHPGSCHCGAVRFEVTVNLSESSSRCNCTLCMKVGNLTAIMKPQAFRVLKGAAELASYARGARTERRYFCKHCGIHVFGRGNSPELGGDFVAINVNALDDVDPGLLNVVHWDGRHDNWRAGPSAQPWPVFATP